MRCHPTRAAVIAPTPTITGVAIDKMKEKGDDEERIQGVAVLNATVSPFSTSHHQHAHQ